MEPDVITHALEHAADEVGGSVVDTFASGKVHTVVVDSQIVDPPIATGVQPGERENHLLLQAGATALRHACPTIVWPVVPQGPAPDSPAPVEAIANIVNRATLMSRLVSLDAGQAGIPEVRVETPFVDLSDAQLADLACDVGARFEDCWWWADDSGAASVERARWGPLLPVPG